LFDLGNANEIWDMLMECVDIDAVVEHC
jgi:hypothetical protein